MTSSKIRNPRVWRWRRCPGCRGVFPAGKLAPVNIGNPWGNGVMKRRCPSCGVVRATAAFLVVREKHPEGSAR